MAYERIFKNMKMIVGLGNIGRKYDETRHNVGFMVLDQFAKEHQVSFDKEDFNALIASVFINGEKVLLVKPTTYMNESGRAVGPLATYYNIASEDIAVIHDDMDLEVGKLRLRQKGSAGGHNGIKSLIHHLRTQEFKRVRVGIGHPQKMSVVDWVLSKFTGEQRQAIDVTANEVVAALDYWLASDDFMKTMNKYNHK